MRDCSCPWSTRCWPKRASRLRAAGWHRLRSRARIVHRRARGGRGDAGAGARRGSARAAASRICVHWPSRLGARCRRGDPGIGCVLACMDARMGEVYWALFELADGRICRSGCGAGEAAFEGAWSHLPESRPGCGQRGLAAYPGICRSLAAAPASRRSSARRRTPCRGCGARWRRLTCVPGRQWLDAAAAQPVYVRDQVVARSSVEFAGCKMPVTDLS